MQKRRNKSRLMLLAVLTVLTLLAFWWIQPENRIDVEQDVFQVEDLSVINRVTLVSDSAEVSLAYDGARWRLNDTLNADPDLISVLFATLQQATPKRAVPRASRDSILQALKTSGVTVSLFEGQQPVQQFLAGGNASKTQSYFADAHTGEVYVMAIPGYRVYVSGILELSSLGWRDKFIFNFNWRNFKRLETSWPKKRSENFVVAMQKDFFGIEGMAEVDTAKLNTFLDNVSLLTVDEYVYKPGLIDSLKAVEAQLVLTITDVGNRRYSLRLYDSGGLRQVLGLVHGNQVAVFDRRKMQQILKPRSFFRKK
jgi:hypothetical protein